MNKENEQNKKAGPSKPGKLKSSFKKALIGGLAALFSAVALEYNGYRILDLPNGNNLLCAVDPNCRKLTPGEIIMARDIFGDQIDYRHVKIFNRPWMWIPFKLNFRSVDISFVNKTDEGRPADPCPPGSATQPDVKTSYIPFFDHFIKIERPLIERNDAGRAPNGNIYFSESTYEPDFSTVKEDKQLPFFHESVHVLQDAAGHNLVVRAFRDAQQVDYDNIYSYKLEEVKDFSDLNLEQQAEFVENYVRALSRYTETKTLSHRKTLEKYMAVLAPYLAAVQEKQEALEKNKPLQPPGFVITLPPTPVTASGPSPQNPAGGPASPPRTVLPLRIAPVVQPACPSS